MRRWPIRLACRLIRNVDQHLEPARVHEVVCAAVPKRSGRRRLAQALRENPSVLRTGRPPTPLCLAIPATLIAVWTGKLLRAGGAKRQQQPGNRMGTWRGGRWARTSCLEQTLACGAAAAASCDAWPAATATVSRDATRCLDTAGDPLVTLVDLVLQLHSGLDADAVSGALSRSASAPAIPSPAASAMPCAASTSPIPNWPIMSARRSAPASRAASPHNTHDLADLILQRQLLDWW
jgi:hypothetical protein